MTSLRALVLSCLLPAAVSAQILDLYPERVAPGETIEFTFRNVTGATMLLPTPCFVIADCWDVPLFPPCAPASFTMGPGAVLTLRWDTRDLNRVPVPPGCYKIWKDYWAGSQLRRVVRTFTIGVGGGSDLRLLQASVQIGRVAPFLIENQWFAGRAYLFGVSFAQGPLIPLADGRLLPLRFDPLFVASQQASPAFRSFAGTLSVTGRATPSLVLPNDTRLIGWALLAAYVTLPGPGARTSVEYISAPLPFTVQP